MPHTRSLIVILAAVMAAAAGFGEAHAADGRSTVLVIVLDGLRPDYLTEELMPNVWALAQDGVACENHHAVFPTVTRVNSASISTGAYPGAHGLMGNTVYFPEIDSTAGLTTSSYENLAAIEKATNGALLTATTLGEVLEAAGERLLVVSSGSAGSATLANHKVSGGAVINRDQILPESLRERVESVLGPAPEDATPYVDGNRWAVDAYLTIGLDEIRPRATIMWLTDPDHTAHSDGIGGSKTIEAVRHVDEEVGRVLAEHRKRGMDVDVIVMSDHGFSTHTGGANPSRDLIEAGLKDGPHSDDVVAVGRAVYVNRGGEDVAARIAQVFQANEAYGAVFSRAKGPGAFEGVVPGTFSFDLVYWNHDRSADVLVDANWCDAENEAGYPGATTQPGVAGHGTLCPWDVHNVLVASGPRFKRGVRSAVPTGNVDIAPTVCGLLGLKPARSMQGRILRELLEGGPDPKSVRVEERRLATQTKVGSVRYEQTLCLAIADGHRYVNWVETRRTPVSGE